MEVGGGDSYHDQSDFEHRMGVEAASAATGKFILQARGSRRARGPGCMKTSPSENPVGKTDGRGKLPGPVLSALSENLTRESTTYRGDYVSKGLDHTEKCCCCLGTSPKCVRVEGPDMLDYSGTTTLVTTQTPNVGSIDYQPVQNAYKNAFSVETPRTRRVRLTMEHGRGLAFEASSRRILRVGRRLPDHAKRVRARLASEKLTCTSYNGTWSWLRGGIVERGESKELRRRIAVG